MTQPDNPAPRRPALPASKLRFVALAAAFAGLVLAAAGAVFLLRPPTPPAAMTDSGVVRMAGGAAIGGPFRLTDQSGRVVTDTDFAGRYMLIYFGFANCPDICPTELQTMGNAVDALGNEGARVVPVFITVDPARDTPEQLKGYVAAFHPGMVGLSGSAEEIAAVAKAYKVYFNKAPGDGAGDSYQVDHTSFVYLMGPDGKLRSLFRAGTSAKAMAAEITAQLRQSS